MHTFAEFSRTDGPADAIAHGYLTEGPVALFAADVAGDEPVFPLRRNDAVPAWYGPDLHPETTSSPAFPSRSGG
jgi:hypothetical protein